MADDIITRYRISVDELRADVDKLIAEYARADKAGVNSTTNVSNKLDTQAKIVDNLRTRILKLTESRNNESDPAKLEKYNKILSEQNKRYDELTKTLNKANKSQDDFLDGSDKVKKSGKETEDIFQEVGKTIIAAFAVEKIIEFAGASIDAFAKGEASAERLRFAVTSIGDEGDIAFQKLIDQSKEIGGGLFSSADIQGSQALQSQFGLTSKQIEELTPKILDLSSALGVDLESATQTALSAITGTTARLKQINGNFEDTGTAVGNYNELMRVLTGIQGTAENALNTTTGALKAQQNKIEDLDEAIGEKLAPSLLNLKSLGLDLKDAFASALQDLFKLIGASPDISNTIDDLRENGKRSLGELTKAYEKEFKNLTSLQLDDKLESSIRLFNEQVVDLARFEKEGNNIAAAGARQRLLDYAAQRDALKALLNDKESGNQKEQQYIADLTKLNSKELTEYIRGLKERTDRRGTDTSTAIALAEKQLEETSKLEKKYSDEAIANRKRAIDQLIAINDKFNEQRLQSFAKTELDSLEISRNTELARARLNFNKAGGNSNPEAVKLFKQAELLINETFDERIAENKIRKANEVQNELKQISEDNLKNDFDATINAIDRSTQEQITAEKLKYKKVGDFRSQAEQQLQQKISEINERGEQTKLNEQIRFINDSSKRSIDSIINENDKLKQIEIDAFNSRGDFSAAAKQRLSDRLNEIDNDTAIKSIAIEQNAAAEKEKISNKLLGIKQKNADKEIDIEIDKEEQIKKAREKGLRTAVQLASALADIYSNVHQGVIDELEFEKAQADEAYDEAQVKLQEDLDNKILTQAQYENQSALLKKKRVESEKKINEEINAEKRKVDQANQLRALFEIAINTAVAVSENLGVPWLAALIAVLGAAQIAVVLSTPLPKYEKGTRYLKRNNGEPMGKDTITIQADEGERIIPRVNNVRHWKWYNSLEDGTFDRRVNEQYVLPALLKHQQEQKKQQNKNISTTLINAMIQQKDSSDGGELFYLFQRLWNKGIMIKNIGDLNNDDSYRSIYKP